MFKKILVPLDGSELAEAALPAAVYLAGTLGAKVTFVHVVEEDAPLAIHGDRHLRTPEEADAYLDGIRGRAGLPAAQVDCHVHASTTADVAGGIVQHEEELSPDLIIMCTHGGGGLKRMFLGSIAQQIVAAGDRPVLLIRPGEGGKPRPFALTVLLAPLDGKSSHGQGLDIALGLARVTGARLRLLSVVPTMGTLAGQDATTGKFMPGTTRALLALAEDDLKSYLAQQVARIRAAGVEAYAELGRGDPAPMIAETAEALHASLIVLATHGKAGNEAFWTNSVAAKVQSQSSRPLLLVPIKAG
jgi:nucleotide-binding universal stress UspA family protein